jgi:HD-like signal output (HDOD) protein
MADSSKASPKNPLTKLPASFDGLSERELTGLYRLAPIKKLDRGEYLIKEGDTDQTVYIILDGLLTVVKNINGQPVEIATLSEGDWVGEIAFTKRIRRTASAVAKIPTSVMTIDKPTLNTLEPETQLFFFRKLNELAALRAADLSQRETQLTAQNQMLMNYIQSNRTRGNADYKGSPMIRGIITKVPRLPAFATDLAVRILDEAISPNEVSEAVKEDPAMVGLVLKTVNSPVYGFASKVSDIHHAIVLLGFNEVYQLIVADGIRRTMPATPVFKELQSHSVAVSHLAFAISQESRLGRPAETATLGLLHDLGIGVVQLLKDKNPALAMLIDALDTAQLGALLLKEWQLPDNLCLAMEYQLSPEFSVPSMIPEEVRDTVTVLHFAHLCHDYFTGHDPAEMPMTFLEDYIALLGWSGLPFQEIADTRVLPALTKKANTFPAGLRRLLQKHKAAANKPR